MNLLNPSSIASFRERTAQLIQHVALSNGESESKVYERILSRLKLHYGIDYSNVQKCGNDSVLDLAELSGHIEKVYSFAYAEFLFLQACNQ